MVKSSRASIQIDLNEFKLHIHLKGRTQLTLHFNSPSRSFYLSVIALVVHEMKKLGKVKSIPLLEHLDLLVLLNETIGGAAGSSDKENLLARVYRKWKDAIPNLEEAPLFKVLGKKKEEGDGAIGKVYSFTDAEKDEWANLFEYMGSEENVRLKFAIDKIGVDLNETSILFGDSRNGEAWAQFIASLEKGRKEESEPVEEPVVSEPPIVPSPPHQQRRILWLSRYRWAALVVVIGIAAGAIWKIYLSPAPIPIASIDRMKYPLPDNPSIAVLPFVNMSEEPKQEFLCDGMTEAIITALSKVPRLFVICRNSTFTYKGKSVKVNQVSEELGVRYVLEGSFQRSGDRVRITVQLIDALKGNHLWAERYDRDLKDIFALQDEITLKILTGIQVKLIGGGDISRAQGYAEKYYKGKQGLDCYLKSLEGLSHLKRYNIDGTRVGKRIAEEANEMCPENPSIYVLMSWAHYLEYWLGLGKSSRESIEKGIEMGQRALAMDDSLSQAHGIMSMLYTLKREHDKSIAAGERAVALEPGGARAHLYYGMSLHYAGWPEEAIPMLQKAIRLNPLDETGALLHLGYAYRATGRFEEAVSEFKKALQRTPNNFFAHLNLAATYSMMGREQEARAEAAEVLRLNPKFSVDSYAKRLPLKDQSATDNFVDALRKAGLK